MGTISVSLPSDGQTIDAADYNTPINTIVTEINGSLDSDNIAEGGVVPNSLVDGTGTSWVWQDWTPTYTNITVGNGTVTAKYVQIGKTVHYRFRLVLGSTSSIGNAAKLTLPVAANTEHIYTQVGQATFFDSGTLFYAGAGLMGTDVNNAEFYWANYSTSNGGQTTSTPFTEATSDRLTLTGTYEAA